MTSLKLGPGKLFVGDGANVIPVGDAEATIDLNYESYKQALISAGEAFGKFEASIKGSFIMVDSFAIKLKRYMLARSRNLKPRKNRRFLQQTY